MKIKIKKPNIGDTSGIIRYMDDLGRFCVPREFRKTLGINEGDQVEVFCMKDGIYARKVQ